jgi:uncharacterized integral membrane protein
LSTAIQFTDVGQQQKTGKFLVRWVHVSYSKQYTAVMMMMMMMMILKIMIVIIIITVIIIIIIIINISPEE